MARFRLILLVLIALLVPVGCNHADVSIITIHGESFEMELALDDAARAQGMAGRTEFPDQGGMLFVFPDSQTRWFWMKDCLIDMDLIFLDSRGVVVAMHEMEAEPLRQDDETQEEYEDRLKRYRSGRPAQFAIELEAGSIRRLGVRVNDRVELELERLKAMAK
ncbi:MAG: DUF192 domain-containing protein [Phycisphaerales bacterium]|nr:MAG: DUF192 domain-containing protein [Phycisphaerales bacterium]